MLRFTLTSLVVTVLASLPPVTSYSKVSKNGQDATKVQPSEGRSISNIAFTVSPVYTAGNTPSLKPGEAIDYPSTRKYSTLDQELLSKLNSIATRNRAQDRFHPPAIFEHSVAHANAMRQQMAGSSSSSQPSQGNAEITYSNPPSSSYSFRPYKVESDSKPMGKPPSIIIDSYPPEDPPGNPKLPDSYSSGPDSDSILNHGSKPIYGLDHPPKSIEFEGHYGHPPPDDSYMPDHYHHEVIYDHIPDDHFHHEYHTTTTEEPEMNDQRVNKRPYSYYYIGKKLWYVPLYFSIYFIIYIAALVFKSIARHKINFPSNLAAVAADQRSSIHQRSSAHPSQEGWREMTTRILEGIEKYGGVFQERNGPIRRPRMANPQLYYQNPSRES